MNQERLKYQSLAFSKHTPTAFVVESPFQLLCAWNAIADFEIADYRIVLVLERNNIRNQQVFDMLQSRNMAYDVCYTDEYGIKDIIEDGLSKRDVLYDRVMIGEILDLAQLAVASLYSSTDSVAVYMDDGAATIRVFTGHSFNQSKIVATIKSLIKRQPKNSAQQGIYQYWSSIGLHDFGFFYTIYSDISTRKYITYPNTFDKLYTAQKKSTQEKAVLIIGALTDDYIKVINISLGEYEEILSNKLSELRQKHTDARIIYIPHGRDNNTAIPKICEALYIEYVRPNTTIELYALNAGMEITHIYGFNSTAHYTLKLITGAQVTQWLLMNKLTPAWYSISEITSYYKKHGIVIDKIPYPKPTCKQWLGYYMARIMNLLGHK